MLEGEIPHAISQCFLLRNISLRNNTLHGQIPSNLSLCSRLQIIDLHDNFLSGIIPPSLGALQALTQLILSSNKLEAWEESDWAFLTALSNCSNLQLLDLGSNMLGGMLPTAITNLSTNLEIIGMNNNKISGSIPPGFCKLIGLRKMYFNSNFLSGLIPAQIAKLHKLELLSFRLNQISGSIPPSISNISTLTSLDLAANKLEGSIPASLGNLSSLSVLYLVRNNLVGDIPPSLGNLHLISKLYLGHNNFIGTIPESLGNLQSATVFGLESNKLTGKIPPSLWNISSLIELYLEENMLVGELPQYNILQNMPRLQHLVLAANNLYGYIPPSLSNSSTIEWIELSTNTFSGKIPLELGNVRKLTILLLAENKLEARSSNYWDFLKALENCTVLEELDLSENERLAGVLPDSIGNLSRKLTAISFGGDQISGNIPSAIRNLINLRFLSLGSNHFTGSIPESIGNLHMLGFLDLSVNELTGEIPLSFGNLTQLNQLYLSFNNLGGDIPSSLGYCKQLEVLKLEVNGLTGSIPREILAVSTIYTLILSNNALEESLPTELGSLINLVTLDVSKNNFSGEIPNSLGKCVELQELYMGHNFLEGVIPSSFSALKSLQELDLSSNRLSGEVPKYLLDFSSLVYLNLSDDFFEGELPTSGIFRNTSETFIFGNDKLCGGTPEFRLPTCSKQASRKRKWTTALTAIVSAVGAALWMIILIFGFAKWRRKLKEFPSTEAHAIPDQHMKMSYAELLKATNRFSNENLIGVGSFGSVYKGNMDNNRHKVIAVKVLNLHQKGASKSFDAECKVLRNTRHRNLVSVLTTCSGADHKGDDFKALVFEFMPNGSLDSWLHPQVNDQRRRSLSLLQRLNIATDVASALDYLHNHGSIPIVHCDIKPSNVLLGDDFTAHVGDFGLANLLVDPTNESTVSTALKGTIGYVAPEYGVANKVSTEGDVFSYGILLLEIFTGKSPTEEIFKDNLNLHKFVEMSLPERLTDVLDPMLYSIEEDVEPANNIEITSSFSKQEMECIISVLNIGLYCSKDSSMDRMQIRHALNELQTVKNVLRGAKNVW